MVRERVVPGEFGAITLLGAGFEFEPGIMRQRAQLVAEVERLPIDMLQGFLLLLRRTGNDFLLRFGFDG